MILTLPNVAQYAEQTHQIPSWQLIFGSQTAFS